MTSEDSFPIKYDVFISYSRRDAAQVDLLAALIQDAGLGVWMDRSALHPGLGWRAEIETAMKQSASALIVWGLDGLGTIQRQEQELAYVMRDDRGDNFHLIHVLLPNAPPPQRTWANVDTWVRFTSSLDEQDTFTRLIAAIKGEALQENLVNTLPDHPAPYRGLAAFEVQDADFFFGRTAYLEEMVKRLRHHPFLAVIGPSGSGKTSLVQAGFLARLTRDSFADKGTCRSLLMRPGPHPLRALVAALTHFQPSVDPLAASDALLKRLQATPDELPSIIQVLLPPDERLVLVIDRLEELFTLADQGREDVRAFVKAILALIRQPPFTSWIVTTMRADFYAHLASYAELADEVVNHQVYVKPIREEELDEVIEAPAAQVGALFETGLAKQVRKDSEARGEVSLPLLQHALDILWRKRRGRRLTWDAYRQIHGVAGALEMHADGVVAALSNEEGEVARRLFTRLIWLEEGEATVAGRRVEKAVLLEQFSNVMMAERILQRLADQRLIVLRGQSEQATAELAHDTLPLHWQQLRKWVQEDREFLLWRQRLRSAVSEWVRHADQLWSGTNLNEAKRWISARAGDLNKQERTFIEKSVRLAFRKRAAVALAVSAITAAVLIFLWARAQQAVTARANAIVTAVNSSPISIDDPVVGALVIGELAQLVNSDEPEGGTRTARSVANVPVARSILRDGYPLLNAGFTRDGKHIVTYARNGNMRMWSSDGLGGPTDLTLPGHTILAADFSTDKPRFLLKSREGVLQIHPNGHQSVPIVIDMQGQRVILAAFAPDGLHILTASDEGLVKLIRADGRGEPVVLASQGPRLLYPVFSGANSHVILVFQPPDTHLSKITKTRGGPANLLRLNDLQKPTFIRSLGSNVVSASFSRNGDFLATGSEEGIAVVSRTDGTGIPLVLNGHSQAIRDIAFSPDGSYVATASEDDIARVWSTDGSNVPLKGHTDKVNSVIFSNDGSRVLTTSADHTARLWPVSGTGKTMVFKGHQHEVTGASFSSDTSRIVTASWDGTARVWDANGTNDPIVLTGHQEEVLSAVFTRDGSDVLTVSKDGAARLWRPDDISHPMVIRRADSYVVTAGFNNDGTRIVTGYDDGTVRVTARDGTEPPIDLREHEGMITRAVFSIDGTRILTSSTDGSARVWNADGVGKAVVLKGNDQVMHAADFNFDASRVVTASAAPMPADTALDTPAVDQTEQVKPCQPAGKGLAHIWRADGKEKPITLEGHNHDVLDVNFSVDGTRVVTASADCTARIWRADGTAERVLSHQGPVLSAAFSLDGHWVVTASADQTARIWRTEGSQDPVVLVHPDRIWTARFSPDATRVVTASDDGKARVWRSDGSGDPVLLEGHARGLRSAAFNRDGSRVVTASRDATARIWQTDWPGLVAYLRNTTNACLTPEQRATLLGETRSKAKDASDACERRYQRKTTAH